MRPVTYTPEDIIEAGKTLQAEGRNITGFALRNKVGGGNPNRLRHVWDEYQAKESITAHESVAELPAEVAEIMKAGAAAFTGHITQLTVVLNDKAVRAAQRRVAEVIRAAERELVNAAQTVDSQVETLDVLRDEHRTTLAKLDNIMAKEQAQPIELAQLYERLAAAEKRLSEAENEAEKSRQQLADMQKRLTDTETKNP